MSFLYVSEINLKIKKRPTIRYYYNYYIKIKVDKAKPSLLVLYLIYYSIHLY